MTSPELLAVERLGDQPPLVVIEAKGYPDTPGIDVDPIAR